MNIITEEDGILYFNCPQCDEQIIVFKNELNCHIFRHAYYKSNFQQVNPHMSKIECDTLIERDMVYGCCKPFEIIHQDGKMYAIKCAYK